MIYNGTPTDGQCNNTGKASQLSSTGAFNINSDSVDYVGYKYRTVYGGGMSTSKSTWMFGINVTYSNGIYILINASAGLSQAKHYTCKITGFRVLCILL